MSICMLSLVGKIHGGSVVDFLSISFFCMCLRWLSGEEYLLETFELTLCFQSYCAWKRFSFCSLRHYEWLKVQ